jgi:type VI secretion system protein ImpB
MDGKAGAEDLIAKALDDPAILQSLASVPKDGGDEPETKGEE